MAKVYVLHQADDPFPRTLNDGTELVGEKCTCGHTSKEHHDFLQYGQGSCACCECAQFTWTSWVEREPKPQAA